MPQRKQSGRHWRRHMDLDQTRKSTTPKHSVTLVLFNNARWSCCIVYGFSSPEGH